MTLLTFEVKAVLTSRRTLHCQLDRVTVGRHRVVNDVLELNLKYFYFTAGLFVAPLSIGLFKCSLMAIRKASL